MGSRGQKGTATLARAGTLAPSVAHGHAPRLSFQWAPWPDA